MFGENYLRGSGLSFAIVRPGHLVDDPGCTKAVQLGQGDTLSGSISRETSLRSASPHVTLPTTYPVN